uniref:YEATS domain-containing protein n=1 Tax=Anabas testudineus TaxID=64144 RepID=A0A3Q1J6M3_ANATE
QCKVQLNTELNNFIHNWTVLVQEPQTDDMQQLVEKVIFHLHVSYSTSKRGKSRKTQSGCFFILDNDVSRAS